MTGLSSIIGRGWSALTRHQDWNIGIVRAPIAAFADAAFVPEIEWLPAPPDGRFAADPFVFTLSGSTYILYESYEFSRETGHIAAMRIAADGSVEQCGPVLTADTHLAYPYVFTWRDRLYCVPENALGGDTVLYRVDRIPGTLTPVATMIGGRGAIDPTVFEHEGRWWLAYTERATGSNEALHLCHAASPLGPWTPHALSPAKRDVASSRPAGTPFVHEGVLYRPAQDCSATYGGRIALNRVDRLTPSEFAEVTVRWIEPDRSGAFPHGLHTISAAGDITVVDGKREHFVAAAALAAVSRNLRRLSACIRKKPSAAEAPAAKEARA